ncbi:MAG: response regulator [Bacteroidales bacterium]|nr:response regulator [Bacteroidales bacterium]
MKANAPILLLLACLFSLPLQAEPYYYFEHYTTHEGLPSNTIHCTYQDRFGFVWIGTRDGLTRFDGYDFRSPSEPGSDMMTNLASMDISEDEDGLIWFTTSSGVGWYNPYTGHTESLGKMGVATSFDLQPDMKGSVWIAGDKLYRYVKESGGIREYAFPGTSPTRIAVDSYDAVWVILADGSLHYYDKRRDAFNLTPFPFRLSDIQAADDGHMIAATRDHQVILIETINKDITPIFDAGKREIRQILERKPGEYWIGTDNGLFVKSMIDGTVSEIHNTVDPHSLSANYITSLSKDKAGNVWIGTYYNGINIWQDKHDEFVIYYPNPDPAHSMIGSIVRSIVMDKEGGIWFCTEDGGLNRLNPDRKGGVAYEIEHKLNMQGLTINQDTLWIYTFGSGIWTYDVEKRETIKHYDLPRSSGCGIRTADGQILAGSLNGLYYFDPKQERFVFDESFQGGFVHTLFQDSRGNLWIGTYGNGVFCHDSSGNRLSQVTIASNRGLTADRITSFFEDSRHRIWITTEGGGVCYTEPNPNLSNLRFKSLTRADGLPSNVTCAVIEDEDAVLWVTSTRGIVRINGDTGEIHDFLFDRQQIMGSQFSYGASLFTRNGLIYVGNTFGMLVFSPAKMKKSTITYPLYITDIHATSGRKIKRLHEPDRTAINSQCLRVKARDAALLSISFSSPNYSILQHITYEYSLRRGVHAPVSARTAENSVHFAGLQPGHYTFEVNILGMDAPNARRTLEFDIQAPLLWSSGAKIIYILILLSMLAIFFYELDMRRRRERARQITRLENEKQKEIYDAKINFFTNITHEIRTPLSLIKMPLDKLIAAGEFTPKAEKDMKTIQANADRLLSLTNQLLDLRKMEKNEITPVFLKSDIAELVRKTCSHFEQMATEQKMSLKVEISQDPFEIMCVRDSVEKIVGNLLSNAVKYTHDQIEVSLKASEDGKTAILRVDSNGALIPARESEKIFEIFYQMGDTERQSKGTGLGLAYARTLAGLHGGRLYLDLNVRDRNSFVLELPVEQQSPIHIETPSFQEELPVDENPGGDHDTSLHTLLIVEDSAEMRGYLARELSDEYNIVTAANGQDAVEKLQAEKVDLVVSDIMMPLMDGCQLCNYIKTNMEFSHLPVLLLTAAVGMETRLQTLEVGADGYIEKPFPIELLRANIASLFKNRDIAYRQFTDSPLTHFNSVNTSKMDEEFMEKLHGIVMKHMAEQDLSIETLTNLIGTSKSTLYRKVKANTGLNINEYIRLCRLKQAAEMLSSQKYRINEVAYMVGFSSPSYFATSFQKQFNISPSSFVKNLKD